jgi:exodeoxyribonuclease V alpha subunit
MKSSGTTRDPEANPSAAHAPTGESVACWLAGEAFMDIDRHFARFMERLSGSPNPEVALAAAMASRSQGQGSICLDLRTVAGTVFPNEGTRVRLQLPALDTWVAALRKAPVVGRPTEFKPLVLDGRERLYLHRYWEYESNLAKAILRRAELESGGMNEALLAEGLTRLFPVNSDAAGTDGQRIAASMAVRKNFCVISGGPGTGKTRTVVALLVLLLEQAGDQPLRIALAAPTGKAAARLQESLRKWQEALPCEAAVRARLPTESFTLHRLLGSLPDCARSKYDAENPLPFDVVVVDEASMVDLALMARLFAATPPAARLILLGDPDQLASVEAGAVLGDICHGGAAENQPARATGPLSACMGRLKMNYRFGADNGILALSQSIHDGDADRVVGLLRETGAGFAGIIGAALPARGQLKARMRERVVAFFRAVLEAGDPAAALKALNRYRILSPLRQGPYGVASLNQMGEEILRETQLIPGRDPWYAGRPILITRNDATLKLFNGDIGLLLPEASSGELRAWFLDGGQIARSLLPVRLPAHETAFAMTIHKSQGSEFEEVLFILPDHDYPVLTRELLYTGVTRASQRVEIWHEESILRAAVGRRIERTSGLREALWG